MLQKLLKFTLALIIFIMIASANFTLFIPPAFATIYVGNLSYRTTEEDLKSLFAEYGEVKRVVLPTDRETGRLRGFAYVDMIEDVQEDSAITELDGSEWMGRQLKVNKARPREEERRSSWSRREE